jgi:peptide/nickel transport system permease protein
VISALKQYSFYEYSLSVVSLFGISIPNFFFALLALWIFGAILGWFPTFGMGSYGEPFNIWDNLYHLVLPATVLSIDSLGGNTRYARMSMLEVLHADYMTTARAKGLSYYVVISRHALRNACRLITITVARLPGLIGGTILIENMFSWPGMGQLTVTSVGYRDYTVLMEGGRDSHISRTRAHSELGRRRSVFVRGLPSPRRGIVESSERRLKQ